MVEIFNSSGKPRYFYSTDLGNFFRDHFELLDSLLDIGILKRALNINEEIDLSPIVDDEFTGSRVDSRHVDVIASQYAQGFVQNTMRLWKGKRQTGPILDLPKSECLWGLRIFSDTVLDLRLVVLDIGGLLVAKEPVLGLESSSGKST